MLTHSNTVNENLQLALRNFCATDEEKCELKRGAAYQSTSTIDLHPLAPEYLSFDLGDQSFALPARYLREITKAQLITPLPRFNPTVLGVFSLRGEIVVMIDLPKILKINCESRSQKYHIILNCDNDLVGITAERIFGVSHMAETSFVVPQAFSSDIRNYVLGTHEMNNHLVNLLKLETILENLCS